MNITLKHIPLQDGYAPGADAITPSVPASEYERRIRAAYDAAQADWLVVYADREHTANLTFLCGFDPRFEEALLVVGPRAKPTLILGNEGMGYTSAAALPLNFVLCQSLSLMGQPRGVAPRLGAVLAAAGLADGASVGVVGWKYMEADECDDPSAPAFVPAFVLAALRKAAGASARIFDATHILMHPTHGLKSQNSAAQIAVFAQAAERAGSAVMRITRGARPGMTEREAFALSAYEGDPLTCYSMLSCASNEPIVGLRSPSSRRLAYGDGITTAIGLRGSLACRAGILTATPSADFIARYVLPYAKAIHTWWGSLRMGLAGGEMFGAVMNALDGAAFAPALNPGHLISIDEWTHTPIFPASTMALASGMALQCDIIPTPMPDGTALNCEDTAAIADAQLRAEIAAAYPDLWRRIQARRAFIQTALGIPLAEEVLPLSYAACYFAPFWLDADLVCVNSEV